MLSTVSGISTLLSGFGVAALIVAALSILFLSNRTKTLGTLQDQTINALKADNDQKDAEIAERDLQIVNLQGQIDNLQGQLTTLQDVVTQRSNVEKLVELETEEHTLAEKRHSEVLTALAKIGAERRN